MAPQPQINVCVSQRLICYSVSQTRMQTTRYSRHLKTLQGELEQITAKLLSVLQVPHQLTVGARHSGFLIKLTFAPYVASD